MPDQCRTVPLAPPLGRDSHTVGVVAARFITSKPVPALGVMIWLLSLPDLETFVAGRGEGRESSPPHRDLPGQIPAPVL